ncbi:hypothetical protein [Butyricicoccus sp. AM78-15b2TA]|uniref:hypothetical protein n=1 Tax=Butyricicoccus sp. AM78-15b2TA TaxID=3002516 RepID=UPI0022E797A7|nr:hypothetical protein [Butyricicoccus sp. AM78-15b2TA]
MAKNKVINTVLTVQDKLSGGLVEAAKNAKKSGKAIDGSMLSATRSVVAFKNKSVKALTDTAKKGFNGLVNIAKTSALAITASITGIAVGFAALDGATEEYRIAQGKLNAGFQAAGFSADVARKSYRNFYAILGDTDTATEASQLLANMAKTEKDVATWTRIAAGVHGTFGDSLPIEGLVESANETARTGQVTGVFADALNWVGILEDDFNAKLEKTTDVSKRNQLIMDTLSKTYDKAADSFYANNQQVVNARRNHATLDEMLAKVGDTSSKLKNQLWVLAGAAEDGSIRSGSALDWIYRKAADLSTWISGLDLSNLQAQVDKYVGAAAQRIGEWLDKVKSWVENGGLTVLADKLSDGIPKAAELAKGGIDLLSDALDKAKDAMQFCKDHSAELKTVVGLLGIAFGMVKLSQFNTGLTDAISNIGGCIQTIGTMIGVTGAQAAATGAATTAQTGLNIAMNANPIGVIILAIEALIAVWLLFGDKITDTAQSLWNKFKDVSIRIGTAFSGAFNKVKNAAKTALEWVASKLSWLNDKIESIPILGSLYKGAKGVLGDAIEWVDNATTGNRSGTSTTGTTQTKTNSKTTTTAGPVKTTTSTTTTVPKPTPSSLLSLPGLGKATGTPYWRGGFTRVNERGGEIMNLPSGTQIIPHDVSVKAAGGRSVTVNVTIQGNVIGNREYTEQVGEYVGRKVLAALGNT